MTIARKKNKVPAQMLCVRASFSINGSNSCAIPRKPRKHFFLVESPMLDKRVTTLTLLMHLHGIFSSLHRHLHRKHLNHILRKLVQFNLVATRERH